MNGPHQAPQCLTLLMNPARIESQYAAVVVSLPALADETGWEGQTVQAWNAKLEQIQEAALLIKNKLFGEININMDVETYILTSSTRV